MPVKDITLNLSHFATVPHDTSVGQNGRARQDIGRVPREELEDRYLHLHEENLLLKQNGNNQEDKIKRLATKLVKLVKDRRRLEQLATGGGGPGARPPARVRDVEMEEMMEELHEKVRGLQADNDRLKQRLLVAKQQAQLQSRRPSPYDRVQSRVDTGRRRTREDSPSPSRLHQRGTRSVEDGGRPPTSMLPRYGHSLLEEARAEIRNLENALESLRAQLEEQEGDAHLLREQLRRKEAGHQEALLQLRQHQADGQRSTVSSNVAMIRVQKQLAERAGVVTVLEGRFLQLQESQKALQASHQVLMDKVEEVTAQLKVERLKSLGLENQLNKANFSQIRTEEVRISDLEKERDLLKENCDKLVHNAFDVSQEQKWRLQEQQLRVQIGQLETALQADLADKNQILDKIKDERDTNSTLAEENKRLQIRFLEQKQQLEQLNERLKFYTKESELGAGELTEALMLIRARKARQSGELSFLEQVEEEEAERRGAGAQSSVWELRGEVEALARKLESDKTEHQVKLEHSAKLLDSRAAKIRKLQAQLQDIAYGTKPYVFKPGQAAAQQPGQEVAEEEEVRLERGENVVELHLGRATLSPAALQSLGGLPSVFFCTYGFYDAELHGTPLVDGNGGPSAPDLNFDFTSRYVVRTDDLFMEYLHAGRPVVELHRAEGLAFSTLAAGTLRLDRLLEQDGRVNGTMQLVGVSGQVQSFGSLEFWLRLRVPMQQSLRLHWERLSALGYVSTALTEDRHCGTPRAAPTSLGSSTDFPYRRTRPCRHDARHPAFDHHAPYAVAMDADLDRYLKAEELRLYVLDYKEEQEDAYLGKARVPLLGLAHNKAISGVFELSSPSGSPAGHIDVTLSWKFPYRSPPGATMTVEQASAQETPARPTPELPEKGMQVEEEEKEEEDLPLAQERKHDGELLDIKEAPLPKPRQKTRVEEEPLAKKVSILDTEDLNKEVRFGTRSPACQGTSGLPEKRESSKLPPITKDEEEVSQFSEGQLIPVSSQSYSDDSEMSEESIEEDIQAASSVVVGAQEEELSDSDDCVVPGQSSVGKKGVPGVTPLAPSATEEEDEDEEEVSQFSEGQLIPVSSQSYSDDSEMSEESIEEDIQAASSVVVGAQEEELSDSDDCVVPGQSSVGKKIVAVSLKPESRAAHDPYVVRLFVEYSLLDLPSEETPLSLPKPAPGQSVHYNYSNVIHVDQENNRARRALLRGVLEGRNPQMESIRFTLVSEPPEEEEQERECEDVGVAYLRIPDILEKQQDLMESRLNVVEMGDSSKVVGTLTVSVEALDALRSIMDDPEHDYT
ncbi:hypothetical protein CRUP_032311, partial [Coryphaenoides rupestris]